MKKMLALVCAAVLLLTCITTAIAAEAVSPLANCAHANTGTTTTDPYYKRVDSSTHKRVKTEVYMCFDCGTVFSTHDITLATGDHYDAGNNKCICGQILIEIPDYRVPGQEG